MNRTARSRSPLRRDERRARGGPAERVHGRFNPDSESLVYVTNMPYEMSWKELKDIIREKGLEVSFAEVLKTREGKSKGVAIVELRSREEAARCVDTIHRHDIGGRKLSATIIREPVPFFRKIKEDTGVDFLARTLERPRGRPISQNRQPSPGFARSYDTFGLSANFLESLSLKPPLVNRVFVTNISYACSVGKLYDVFALAGRITWFDLQLDADGKSKGMAIIEYSHPIEAVQAISMLSGQKLIDRMITVKMDRFEKDPDRDRNGLPNGLRGIGMGLGANGNPLSDLASIIGQAQSSVNNGVVQPFVQNVPPSLLNQPSSFSGYQPPAPVPQPRVPDPFDQMPQYMPPAGPLSSYQQSARQLSPSPANNSSFYGQLTKYTDTPYKQAKSEYANGDSFQTTKQDFGSSNSRLSSAAGYGTSNGPPATGRATATNYTTQSFDHPTRVILIKNLPPEYSFGIIANRLNQYGEFESLELVGQGIAKVRFLHVQDAEMARQALHNQNVEGSILTCDYIM